MGIVRALVGLASLLLGRQLFWLFVGAAGFLLGATITTQFFSDQSQWIVLLVAIVAGVIGSLLAVVAQRLAVGVAGFIVGGYALIALLDWLGVGTGDDLTLVLSLVVFIVGGIVGAGLVTALFDPALIVLSAITGAALLGQAGDRAFDLGSTVQALLFVVLLVIGIGVQWGAWQRQRPQRVAERSQRADSG